MGSGLSDGPPDGLALVAAEVVEDDDVTGVERWDQGLLDLGPEPVAVDRAVKHHRGLDPVVAQGGDEGQRGPAAVRDLGHEPFAATGATVGAGHVGLGLGLVDEDQAARINPVLVSLPSRPLAGHVRSVLLGCVQALF